MAFLEIETSFCNKHQSNLTFFFSSYSRYVAVYYKEPEVKTNADNQASSKTETHIRNRRDAVSCVGHRRMKRSCVIIPSPPPKPTTPSALKAGTRAPNVDFRGNTFNSNETLNYYIRVFLSNCLFWDEESENWINKGCKVSKSFPHT